TMPGGWKMGQLDPKQPCSTYSEFKQQILNEIARCLNMPFNIAAGNSSGYNYASGRLDHQTYHKSIRVERSFIATAILDRIFSVWLREYALSAGKRISGNIEHAWFWDGFEHVDPVKEANATDIRLKNGTTTYAAVFARQGRDWESEFAQIAKERKKMAELGIEVSDLISNQTQGDVDDE
ncbi:MAG: phage portal protein, partial [Lentisphaeria bacterium]|nr:phage portal protein [Lentisphaeria bacterium]